MVVMALVIVALSAACASRSAIPGSENGEGISFQQLQTSPESHRGRLVTLGGEVFSAKRLKDATRIEVLQLPLQYNQEPSWNRTQSEGRFLAFQRDFLDPATIPPGTRVTIIGHVTGTTTQALDETEYTYPTLDVTHLKVWPRVPLARAGAYPYPYPYWRPYGGIRPWGSPYWWW